jgi:hypothetical protein
MFNKNEDEVEADEEQSAKEDELKGYYSNEK